MMEQLAATSEERPKVFISFAWRDGAAYAGLAARAFSENGLAVWLDHFTMPRRLRDGRVSAPKGKLANHLKTCIGQSKGFLQIGSPHAVENSDWCAAELRYAEECGDALLKGSVRVPARRRVTDKLDAGACRRLKSTAKMMAEQLH